MALSTGFIYQFARARAVYSSGIERGPRQNRTDPLKLAGRLVIFSAQGQLSVHLDDQAIEVVIRIDDSEDQAVRPQVDCQVCLEERIELALDRIQL